MTDEEYLNESPFAGYEEQDMHGFLCTRPAEHTGIHVACTFKRIITRWSTDYQPLPSTTLL